MSHNRSVAVT